MVAAIDHSIEVELTRNSRVSPRPRSRAQEIAVVNACADSVAYAGRTHRLAGSRT